MVVRRGLLAGLAVLGFGGAMAQPSGSSPALKALTEGGAVALIRHATAPGTGDPPGFRLDECATQRNLSDMGRRQATELGERLRRAGVRISEVRSSRWCRAIDTARLAFPDVAVVPDPAIDSFFENQDGRSAQTEAARALIRNWRGPGTLALVTHQVNITALTDIFPAEGEIVVLRPGGGVVGRIRP